MAFDFAILTAVEDTQTAALNGAAKLAELQDKAAAFAAAVTQDASDQAGLVTAANSAIDAAIAMLQALRTPNPAPEAIS